MLRIPPNLNLADLKLILSVEPVTPLYLLTTKLFIPCPFSNNVQFLIVVITKLKLPFILDLMGCACENRAEIEFSFPFKFFLLKFHCIARSCMGFTRKSLSPAIFQEPYRVLAEYNKEIAVQLSLWTYLAWLQLNLLVENLVVQPDLFNQTLISTAIKRYF